MTSLNDSSALSGRLQLLGKLADHPMYQHLNNADFFSEDLLMQSPLLLPDMEQAIEMLEDAVAKKSKIMIAGDRDVDGVTSTAMLTSFLRGIGFSDDRIISVNSTQGDDYGLTGSFLDQLCLADVSLVILLDMGSGHLPEARSIQKTGKHVMILDHHIAPDAFGDLTGIAFVNPRLIPHADQLEHEGKIATVGLVYKLILAFEMKRQGVWNQCIVITLTGSTSTTHYVYRTGAFLDSYTDFSIDSVIKSLANTGCKIYRYALTELRSVCSIFEDRSVNDLQKMLIDSPVRFGQYLFGCTLLRRKELLTVAVREADLASIGLVADLVPLLGENRCIVALGLGAWRTRFMKQLKLSVAEVVRPGLLALLYELNLDPLNLNSRDLNFAVNPMLNAAGRLGKTEKALQLLLCSDIQTARLLASDLKKLNQLRKERTDRNFEIVETHFDRFKSSSVAFFYHERLEPGVSGIMAARLIEMTGLPAIWVNPDGEHARGSGRGMKGWNMLELLQPLSDYLIQVGGHAEACGFTVRYDKIAAFEEALYERAIEYENSNLTEASQHKNDNLAVIEMSADELEERLLSDLRLLEPFGPGHPEPVFLLRSIQLDRPSLMKNQKHLKFSVAGSIAEFVYWNSPKDVISQVLSGIIAKYDVTGSFEENTFRGIRSLRFRVQEIKPA